MTSTVSDQNEPSDISQIAITCLGVGEPDAGRNAGLARRAGRAVTLMTLGCGFFSVKTWIALT